MERLLELLNCVIWGIPVLILILMIGILYSVRSGFIQIRLFPRACKEFIYCLKHGNEKGISGYRALCTALAATVGTGNIVGVAGAIAIGGPGVVFWMWVCAILGMVIKFAEVVLAMKFREVDSLGDHLGGPMYIIKNGLPEKYHILASIYAFFGVVATLGIGNATQVNAVIGGIQMIAQSQGKTVEIPQILFIGITIAFLILLAFQNGASGIGKWAEKLVPPASIIYIFLTLLFLIIRADQIPAAFMRIITGAFAPKAVTCGTIASFFLTMRVGASRGVFTNEAGMGTASIAHSGANVTDPVSQGLLGSIEVFFDTIIMCTLTAFVILCSGISIPFGSDPGIQLTMDAFASVLGGWSTLVIAMLICIFAFATTLGWGLYGMRCMQYLFGSNTFKKFLALQFCAVIAGALLKSSSVWLFSEIVNGLMAIPNLIALYLLFPVFLSQIKKYEKQHTAS